MRNTTSASSLAVSFPVKRAGVCALAAIMACSLSLPSLAFAVVKVDETELAQGENAVGGGKATLGDSTLDMQDVTAHSLSTDEDLTMNFNGGNVIEEVGVTGSAEVEMNFEGENDVQDILALDSSDVTINANGHNDFETVLAMGDSNMTVNVAGENTFESIGGVENASITVRGTDCQKTDVINLGDGETVTGVSTRNGDLKIDHVTINLQGETATIGSEYGNVSIDTSKIAQDDGNKDTEIFAGAAMLVRESVIDITGTVWSKGQMTLDHSDLTVKEPDPTYGASPYRVYSETGIRLIREKNGTVGEGSFAGNAVCYLDTDGNDGKSVNLKADGEPAYYRCADCRPALVAAATSTSGTGDDTNPFLPLAVGVASMATAAYASRRSAEQDIA